MLGNFGSFPEWDAPPSGTGPSVRCQHSVNQLCVAMREIKGLRAFRGYVF